MAKALYVNVVLWEYLGSIGALDLLYFRPEERYSPYDGLAFFRINPLGAFLLGQSARYTPSYTVHASLFDINPSLLLTVEDPEALTTNQRNRIQRYALAQDHGRYRLDRRRILDALESGTRLEQVTALLDHWNKGPLPTRVTEWLEEIRTRTHAFEPAGTSLLIEARSEQLLRMVIEDPVLGKLARIHAKRTLSIPSSKETAFRKRLKELGYLL